MFLGRFEVGLARPVLLRLAALLVVTALASCGQSDKPKNETDGGLSVEQRQLIFDDPRFASDIVLHIPADNYAASQLIAAQGGKIPWELTVRMAGCPQSGSITMETHGPEPYIDGYPFPKGTLSGLLESSGLRITSNYTVLVLGSPWGDIQRTYSCAENQDGLRPYTNAADIHGALAIPVASRICSSWTYTNTYRTPMAGRGEVEVFAGTFTYTLASRVQGVSASGTGTAAVKMYRDPDNGGWVLLSYQLTDPSLTLGSFGGPIPPPSSRACGSS